MKINNQKGMIRISLEMYEETQEMRDILCKYLEFVPLRIEFRYDIRVVELTGLSPRFFKNVPLGEKIPCYQVDIEDGSVTDVNLCESYK